MNDSKYAHDFTFGLANYKGKPLTTGCAGPRMRNKDTECNFKTEIMDMTTLTWSDGPNYPFGEM